MTDYYEAVVFFEKTSITREMRLKEFEAVLDGYVGLSDMANRRIKAAFLHIDYSLNLKSIVFFIIEFDGQGLADTTWNLPIERLAEAKDNLVALDGKAIQMVYSGLKQYQSYSSLLWNPEDYDANAIMANVIAVVDRNKLRFKRDTPEEDIPVVKEIVDPQQEMKLNSEHIEALVEKRLLRLKAAYKKKLNSFQEHRQQEIEKLKAALKQERDKVGKKAQFAGNTIETLSIEKERLENVVAEVTSELNALQNSLSDEKDKTGLQREEIADLSLERRKMADSISVLKDQLKRSREKAAALIEENAQLQDLHEAAEDNKSEQVDEFINRLVEFDLMFVAYHAGAGHISIPAEKLSDYLSESESFAAQKCNVSLDQYRLWLTHFNDPRCQTCGEKVKKVSMPSDFADGIHNRCIRHKEKS